MKTTIKYFIVAILMVGVAAPLLAQQSAKNEAKKFQKELNKQFRNPKESPLSVKDFQKFKKHPFFPINDKFRVVAKFTRSEDPETFEMKTSTDRLSTHDKYGVLHFQIDGVDYRLTLYQDPALSK
ncbi:MAG: DUF1684 domain-containing protein, partial [Bacteroidota bacterium]